MNFSKKLVSRVGLATQNITTIHQFAGVQGKSLPRCYVWGSVFNRVASGHWKL